jgi:hypothetical protein
VCPTRRSFVGEQVGWTAVLAATIIVVAVLGWMVIVHPELLL